MLSPNQAFTYILGRFPEAQNTVAQRRYQMIQPLTDCFYLSRYIISPKVSYSEIRPDISLDITSNLEGKGLNFSTYAFIPHEDVVTIRRAKYTNRFVAHSSKVVNVFTVNQRKLWETLGWSMVNVGSVLLAEIPRDWRILSPILALGLILKDYKGLASHEFEEYEAQILYTFYDLNYRSKRKRFAQSKIRSRYRALFDQKISKTLLEKILAELIKLQTIARHDNSYQLNETITIEY